MQTRITKYGGQQRSAFTLIEIIGVVAIIAILAGVMTPRVIKVIARGKVNSTAQSIASLKTSTTDYIAKNGSLPVRDGSGATNSAVATGRFDADLIASGFTERLFAAGIGSQLFDSSSLTGRAHVRSQSAGTPSGTVSAPSASLGGTNFDLDRDTATADFTTGTMVVCAFIPGVGINDAIDLNKLVDGDVNTGTGADITGRCIYSAADANNNVTVYVYVAHY